MGLSIWASGVPLHALGTIGDLEFSTTWPGPRGGGGGFLVCSWSMNLPRAFNHPALRLGAPVELSAGPVVVGRAFMAEPDRNEWAFTADGVLRQGERFGAVDSSGAASADVSVVVAAAIARGLAWKVPQTGLPGGAVGTDPSQYPTVTDVLNAYCTANGKRWWIDRDSTLQIGTDPTSPTWALAPGTPSMSSADDDFATRIWLRYLAAAATDTTPDVFANATAVSSETRWGVQEISQDVSNLGVLTSSAATALAQSILANNLARPAFTSSVKPGRGALTNPGGVDATAAPWLVRAGQMIRHHGWRNLDGVLTPGMSQDWILGGTTWSSSDGLTLTPMGLAGRTATEVLAQQFAPKAAA
jgi:hypothetical protein